MDHFEQIFGRLGPTGQVGPPTLEGMFISLLLAFAIGQVIAIVYARTHHGLSYSRSFTQSLVLLVIIAALVMFVIGDDVVAAFGLIGALAIIRFRNVLKDTRDTAFVFMSLVLGMAVGAERHGIAVVGGSFLLMAAIWLHVIRFGTNGYFDGHLSYRTQQAAEEAVRQLRQLISAYCRKVVTVTVHDGGGVVEHVLQVRLRDRSRGGELLDQLREVEGVDDVSLVLRDDHAEL
ncbi:MAG: DUF4956 domain-containing protein [Planctomycetota bacterium]|nr:DUF4956 domain-containing protein [Planctomycetota bacterium]